MDSWVTAVGWAILTSLALVWWIRAGVYEQRARDFDKAHKGVTLERNQLRDEVSSLESKLRQATADRDLKLKQLLETMGKANARRQAFLELHRHLGQVLRDLDITGPAATAQWTPERAEVRDAPVEYIDVEMRNVDIAALERKFQEKYEGARP